MIKTARMQGARRGSSEAWRIPRRRKNEEGNVADGPFSSSYSTEKVAWTVTVISFFRVDVSCTP